MNFLKKLFSSTTRLICLVLLLSIFNALPALADNCSENQRVPLPGCVSAEYVQGGSYLQNNCDFDITIKVDIANARDKLINIPKGTKYVVSTDGRFKLSCCPEYSKCS
jgi:hypothetical protein